MTLRRFLLLSFLILSFVGCRNKEETCTAVRNGKFYFYPSFSKTKGAFAIIRSDSVQKEIDYTTGDTSLWSVEWLDDCDYRLQYQKGISGVSEEEAETLRQRLVYVRILDVSKDYYRIKINGGILRPKGELDTMWRKAK